MFGRPTAHEKPAPRKYASRVRSGTGPAITKSEAERPDDRSHLQDDWLTPAGVCARISNSHVPDALGGSSIDSILQCRHGACGTVGYGDAPVASASASAPGACSRRTRVSVSGSQTALPEPSASRGHDVRMLSLHSGRGWRTLPKMRAASRRPSRPARRRLCSPPTPASRRLCRP